MVLGNSGIGKIGFVQGVKESVKTRNGWFIEGKFDQYQQNTPLLYAPKGFVSTLG